MFGKDQASLAEGLTLFLSDEQLKVRYSTTATTATSTFTTAHLTTTAMAPTTTRSRTTPFRSPSSPVTQRRQTRLYTTRSPTRQFSRDRRGVPGQLASGVILSPFQWYHVVVSCGPAGLSIWIDEMLAAVRPDLTTCLTLNTNDIVLAATNWDGYPSTPMHGALDDVGIADSQLSPSSMILLALCAHDPSDPRCSALSTLSTVSFSTTLSTPAPTTSSSVITTATGSSAGGNGGNGGAGASAFGGSSDTSLIIVVCKFLGVRPCKVMYTRYIHRVM